MPRTVARTLALLLLALSALRTTAQTAPARPVPGLDRVVLISIDGLRPDVLLRADAPAIRQLMDRGSFTLWANTTDVAITLPSHTSMVTGVSPQKHGVTWNDDSKLTTYPKVPTLFELAHRAGYTTALVAGKRKFESLARPGTVDALSIPLGTSKVADDAVRDAAIDLIRTRHPDVLMVHFPQTDAVGHADGWGSPQQLATVANADRGVAAIVAALRAQGLLDTTLIIVTADHGGAGKGHGGLDPRSRHIPWIVAGPGVRQNYDLTLDDKLVVNTTDTFATILYVLGLPVPDYAEGKPITEAFAAGRQAASAPATGR